MDEQKYKRIFKYLKEGTYPRKVSEGDKTKLRQQSEKFTIQEQNLFRKIENDTPKRVVQSNELELVLFDLHRDQSAAHLGTDVTFEKAKERYYWPKMRETIKYYIKECDNCQRRGKPSRKENLIPITVGPTFQ